MSWRMQNLRAEFEQINVESMSWRMQIPPAKFVHIHLPSVAGRAPLALVRV